MIYLIVLLIILLVFLVGMGIIGIYFTNESFKPKYWGYEEAYDNEVEHQLIDPDVYNQIQKEEIYIESDYNCKLHGIYFPLEGAIDTVIVVHGYSYNLFGSVKFMTFFRNQGYNVLIYDQRGHGKSGPSLCSMGHIEKEDLKKWVDYIVERNGTKGRIGTHGTSMGGATVLLHGAMDHRVDFIIADCPFAKVWDQFSHVLKTERHLPVFPILHAATLVSYFRIGTTFSNIAPIKVLKDIKVPIFFVHGKEDGYIPPKASEDMYNVYAGPKRLYLANDADHAYAYFEHPDRYEEEVRAFLKGL